MPRAQGFKSLGVYSAQEETGLPGRLHISLLSGDYNEECCDSRIVRGVCRVILAGTNVPAAPVSRAPPEPAGP